MRRWLLFIKNCILVVALPGICYLQLCSGMALHYRAQFNHYEAAGMDISSGWPQLHNFDDYHVCLARRYLAAGDEIAHRPTFDVWWMIRNWNRDFLADQPPCNQPKAGK